MSEREEDVVKGLENAEVTELEDQDLEDVAGGNNNCGCINSPCAEEQQELIGDS